MPLPQEAQGEGEEEVGGVWGQLMALGVHWASGALRFRDILEAMLSKQLDI